MSLRPTSLTVHLWVGLFAAVFLFLEGTTGGIIAWGPEIFRLANPPGPRISPPDLRVAPGPAELPLTGLVGGLEKSHPGFRVVRMAFGARSDQAWSADLQSRALASLTVWFDPHTGRPLGERAFNPRRGWVLPAVRLADRLHGNVVAAAALLVLAGSGLIRWWPRKILWPRRPVSRARTNFDLHNSVGFATSLFLVVFAGTALIMATSRPSLALLRLLSHAPPASRRVAAGAPPRPSRLKIRLDLDQALDRAAAALPDAKMLEMRRLDDGDRVVEFSYRPANGPAPSPQFVLVDPMTGRVQLAPDSEPATWQERVVRFWVPRIHRGEIYGRPTRWIAGLIGFLLAFLAVTGPAIWWLRRRGGIPAP